MYKMMLIAPYEGLCKLAESKMTQYGDFSITIEMGDLQQGVEIARRAEREGYDVILSRGGTAEIIEKNTSIPVVTIRISGYDLLRVIRLSQYYSGALALVGFPHITQSAETACRLLCSNIEIFTINSEQEAEKLLYSLSTKNYEAFIGDVTIARVAKRLGLNSILITSGNESLDDAIEEARRILSPLARLRTKNEIWKHVVSSLPQTIVIVDREGETVFLNNPAEISDLDEMIREHYAMAMERPIEIMVPRGLEIYHIRSILPGDGSVCFIINKESVAEPFEKGISFHIPENCEVPFGYLNTQDQQMKQTIERAKTFAASGRPVLIWGEPGTGRDQLANSIHLSSAIGDSQFITFDCQLLAPETCPPAHMRRRRMTW